MINQKNLLKERNDVEIVWNIKLIPPLTNLIHLSEASKKKAIGLTKVDLI